MSASVPDCVLTVHSKPFKVVNYRIENVVIPNLITRWVVSIPVPFTYSLSPFIEEHVANHYSDTFDDVLPL